MNAGFHIYSLVVYRVGIGHCFDVGIVPYHQKEVIIGLVDLIDATTSRDGIGNHSSLGIQFWRW